MSERDKILARIRKLLAFTPGSGATEAEAASALAMARKLMDQYNLDTEQVEAYAVDGPDWVTETVWEGPGVSTATDADFISPILGTFFHVRSFVERKPPPNFGVAIRFFGERHNVEVARWVYVFLSGIFADLWAAHRVKTRAQKRQQRAFYVGLAQGLNARLWAERKQQASDGGKAENGLARIDKRIDEAMEAALGEMPTKRRGNFRDTSTIRAGINKGREINIARPLGAGQDRAIEQHKPLPGQRSLFDAG